MVDKNSLRKLMLLKRAELNDLEKSHLDQKINQKLMAFLITRPTIKNLALYIPIKNEVAFLDNFLDFLKLNKITSCFPSIVDQFNIKFIDQNNNEINPNDIDCFFIPLLAFNKANHRIGFGKGYYDRYLSLTSKKQLKIGIAYDFQYAEFTNDPWDYQLDLIICNG
ncbi:5-formyltetrahydrofolate cyclo-ligase [Mycoplasmoides genitalium]|uniref:5-formyltetrahydrofolate cyclo-ligase n=1 Tax=Mycoplasmoides genitalium TaxID=2097 RepID=UPI002FCE3622